MALGAGRGRVLRQLLTESLCLSAAGGALGLAFAALGTRALVALASAGQTWNLSTDLDARVIGFTALVSVASSILFGLAPALAAAQGGPRSALAANTRTHTGSRSRQLAARGFIIAQVSLSLLLVAGALLLVRSVRNLAYQDFGFETENVVEAQLDGKNVFKADAQEAVYRRVRDIPGVLSAGVASGGLLSQSMGMLGDDIALPERVVPASAGTRTFPVTAGSVETMGFKLMRGRVFADTDRDGPKVAIISESAASAMFGTHDPIGGTFSMGAAYDAAKAFQVIGVIHDIRFRSPREPFQPLILGLVGQMHMYLSPSIMIRTRADAVKMGDELRRAVAEATPGVGIFKVTTLRQEIQVLARRERLLAWLSGAFGVLTLILAAVGLYGVIAYAAERRTQEIGVRLALGATPRQVRGLLLREVLGLLAAGLAIGGIATVVLSRSLGSLLFGLSANDPVTLGLAVALLSAVALFAGYVPARRAAQMSAMDALRAE
jgi:predicted permease